MAFHFRHQPCRIRAGFKRVGNGNGSGDESTNDEPSTNPPSSPGTPPDPTPEESTELDVSLSASTTSGTVPFRVVFDATVSGDAGENAWYINDRQIQVDGPRLTYTFRRAGEYLVTCSVYRERWLGPDAGTTYFAADPTEIRLSVSAVVRRTASSLKLGSSIRPSARLATNSVGGAPAG